jgi:hypothetical protein
VFVISSTMRSFVVAVSVVLALGACKGRETAGGAEVTETIAPAEPQPAPMGTDAMTETVDVEDSRSISEGATLEDAGSETSTADTAGTQAPAAAAPTTTTR